MVERGEESVPMAAKAEVYPHSFLGNPVSVLF